MLNLTSKIQTIVIYALISLLVGLGSAYTWEHIKNTTLKNEIDRVTLNAEKFDDAEKSCKKTLKKLIANNKKKSEILQRYKSRVKGITNEKIDSVDNFIDFADRMR